MLSKSDKRLESKKRKAEAFLNLVKEEAQASSSQEPNGEAGQKQARTDKAGVSLSADEMIAAYKKELKERQKASMQKPKLFLTLDELTRDHPVDSGTEEIKQLPPLFITDVQHLILYALQGNYASIKPRWCRLLRVLKVDKVVAVVLDSLAAEDFKEYSDSLPTLKGAFDICTELVAPAQYGGSVREDLINVPLSIRQMQKFRINTKTAKNVHKESANISNSPRENSSQDHCREDTSTHVQEKATENSSQDLCREDTSTYVQEKSTENSSQAHCQEDTGTHEQDDETDGCDDVTTTHDQDMFDRTCLLLNPQQMMYEGYPLPLCNQNVNCMSSDFVYSKERYKQVTKTSPLFAIDCEMVQTRLRRNELARVSVVNEKLECIYDTLVKPHQKVIDYVTRFSGITKELLAPVTTRLEDVQKHLSEILPEDGILCGQSLNGDLHSLKMYHPYVVDTSVIYNLTGKRYMKTGLRRLTEHFLRRDIQSNPSGHNSIEDATATMELVLLKLRSGLTFGDLIMSGPEALIPYDQDSVQKMQKTHENCNNEKNRKNAQSQTIKDHEKNREGHSLSGTTYKLDCDNPVNQDSINKRRVFYQRKGNKYVQSFFDVIKKQDKTGKVTDSEDCTPLYSDKQLIQTADSDKKRQLLVNSSVQETDFNLVHLYGFKQFLQNSSEEKETDEEAKKKCLWKLDRRVWKILRSVPSRSIFIVILTGRLEDQFVNSAMTFAKVT